MKIKIFFLCFSLAGFVCNSIGQNQSNVDSLLNALKGAKEDTNKVNTLNVLSNMLSNSNPDTSIKLSNQALSLSKKISSKKHIANSYHGIAWANLVEGSYQSALENNLIALSLREEVSDKPGIAKSLGGIGNVYFREGDYTKALDYYFKALKMADHLGNENQISRSLNQIGNVYNQQGEYSRALDCYFKSLKMEEHLRNDIGIIANFNNIGLVYYRQGNYPKSLDYYFKALKMDEELGNKIGIADDLGNIGGVFHSLEDDSKALEYYFKALNMAEQLGDKVGIALHFSNIGFIYSNQKNYLKSLDYYFRALKMEEELGEKYLIAHLLGNIGITFEERGDYRKALDYYFKALKMDEALGNRKGIAKHFSNIGIVYTKTGKFVNAEEVLKKAIVILDSIDAIDGLMSVEESLSQLYETTGRYQLALNHYKKAVVLKDTLFNQEKHKEITRKEMNYEFEKTQAIEKAGHEKELAVADVEIKKQKVLKYSFIGSLGLTILLFFLGYHFYRAQQDLRLQTIRNNISGDLHDDIGSTLNSISIYSEVAKRKDEHQDEALEMIGDASRKIIGAMSDIVWTINPENDSFAKIIFRMKSLAYNLFRAKNIEFTFQSDDILDEKKLSIEERRNIYLIFKEAVNNLVKYSNANNVSIAMTNEIGFIKMRIEDNGVGFDTSQDTEGNGLKIMKRRAHEMKAKFKLESSKGNGTQIELILKA